MSMKSLPGCIRVTELVRDPAGKLAGIENPIDVRVSKIVFTAPRVNTEKMEVAGSIIGLDSGISLHVIEAYDLVYLLIEKAFRVSVQPARARINERTP